MEIYIFLNTTVLYEYFLEIYSCVTFYIIFNRKRNVKRCTYRGEKRVFFFPTEAGSM